MLTIQVYVELSYLSAIPQFDISPKDQVNMYRNTYTLMFVQHYLSQPGNRASLDVHQHMESFLAIKKDAIMILAKKIKEM